MFFKGVRDPGALTPVDRIRFTWVFYEIFGAFEFIHDEARKGGEPPRPQPHPRSDTSSQASPGFVWRARML